MTFGRLSAFRARSGAGSPVREFPDGSAYAMVPQPRSPASLKGYAHGHG